MRMTEDELSAHLARHNSKRNNAVEPKKTQKGNRALGRLKQGVMNKTEAKYATHLEQLKVLGEISWYSFEAWKFRLANKTFYSPDFIVMRSTGELEAHEVKGYWEDDARVKIKVAAQMHPLQFIAVMWNKNNDCWDFEYF